MASLPDTDDAAKKALEEDRKKRLLAGRGDLGGGGTVDPTSSAPIEAKGAEGATFGASGTKEFADEPFGKEGAATEGIDPLAIGGAEGKAVAAQRESEAKAKQRAGQSAGAKVARQAEEEARQELTAETAAGEKLQAQRKAAGKAEKKVGRDIRGLKKETKKAERAEKKGAAATGAAETAVEDVAESVAGAGEEAAAAAPTSEAVSGASPTKAIKPAGRIEEMSLRQLRERERGTGVGGLLGTGGARGDVRRRMRQGTIHTEEGQEALAGFQEAREARQGAQEAKREARGVLRGGESSPRDSQAQGFRNLREAVASRATAVGEALTPTETAEKEAPAPTPAPAPTRTTIPESQWGKEGIPTGEHHAALTRAEPPVAPEKTPGWSEAPLPAPEEFYPRPKSGLEEELALQNDPTSYLYRGYQPGEEEALAEAPTGEGYGSLESSLAAFNEPSGLVGSFLAGGRGHRGTRARAGQMHSAIMQTDPGTEGAQEMAQDLSALLGRPGTGQPEGMPPEDYMRAVIDSYRAIGPTIEHHTKSPLGRMWNINDPQVIGEAQRMFAEELSSRL
jgi:hypothetical protein